VVPLLETPLLETVALTKHFPQPGSLLRRLRGQEQPLVAVEDVSLSIQRGETLGLVGESGSGKSTFGRLLLQLEKPTSGDILFEGRSVLGRGERSARELRKRIQVIFQDPYSSLNPTMTVRQMLEEVLHVHAIVPKEARAARVRTSSAVVSVSGSASPARSRSSRSSSLPTRRSRRSTSPCRRRCST